MAEREIRCTDVTVCVLDQPNHQDALNLDSGELIGRGGFLPLTESATPLVVKSQIKSQRLRRPQKQIHMSTKAKLRPVHRLPPVRKQLKGILPKLKLTSLQVKNLKRDQRNNGFNFQI